VFLLLGDSVAWYLCSLWMEFVTEEEFVRLWSEKC
jgi:hypothetical protein